MSNASVRALTTVAMLVFAVPALASTDLAEPAETPPFDFAGRQFVDSRGCAYIRAEVDGAVSWIPRLASDRTVLCGFQPTFSSEVAASTGSLPVVRPDTPPAEVETAPVVLAAAVAERRPAAKPDPAAAKVVRVNGTSAAPAAKQPVYRAAPAAPSRTATSAPRGYRQVWDDGRLNPQRGKGTPRGEEMMRRIWTDDVPMRLVGE